MSSKKQQRICPSRRFTVVCCLALLFREVMRGDGNVAVDSYAAINNVASQHEHRQPKLGDGCYHIFLDVGANIGIHSRFLMEPRLYPKARIARSFFRTHFGPEEQRDNRDFCMFAFEPNPSHIERHQEMQQEYEKMGWRYHFIQGGVSDVDGNLTFYHTGDEYGYTTLKSSCRRRCDANHVPVYRLVDWIKQEIDGRLIPEPYGAGEVYDSGPCVVMKLDIEMMEWIVFPDLLLSGVMCNDITAMMGEFHLKPLWYLYPITFQGHASKTRGDTNFTIPKWEEARMLKEEWVTMIERNPNCNTTLDLREDESYRTDGVSWPVPSNVNATI